MPVLIGRVLALILLVLLAPLIACARRRGPR